MLLCLHKACVFTIVRTLAPQTAFIRQRWSHEHKSISHCQWNNVVEPSGWWNPDWSVAEEWEICSGKCSSAFIIWHSLFYPVAGPRGLITPAPFGGPCFFSSWWQTYGFRLCVSYNTCESWNNHPAFLIEAHPRSRCIRTLLCVPMWSAFYQTLLLWVSPDELKNGFLLDLVKQWNSTTLVKRLQKLVSRVLVTSWKGLGLCEKVKKQLSVKCIFCWK